MEEIKKINSSNTDELESQNFKNSDSSEIEEKNNQTEEEKVSDNKSINQIKDEKRDSNISKEENLEEKYVYYSEEYNEAYNKALTEALKPKSSKGIVIIAGDGLGDTIKEKVSKTLKEKPQKDIKPYIPFEISSELDEARGITRGIDKAESNEILAYKTSKGALFNYLTKISFFKNLYIKGLEPKVALSSVKDSLKDIKEMATYEKIFKESESYTIGINNFSKGLMIPLQLLMGLVYKSLKEFVKNYNKENQEQKIKFDECCKKLTPQISDRYRQRLMVASDIIDCDVDDKYYTIGFEKIFNLMSLRRNGVIDDVETYIKALKDFSINSEVLKDNYEKFVDLTKKYYNDIKIKVDKNLYGKIFNIGGNITKRDIDFINKFGVNRNNFGDDYIDKLFKNDFNTDQAIADMEKLYGVTFVDPLKNLKKKSTLVDSILSQNKKTEETGNKPQQQKDSKSNTEQSPQQGSQENPAANVDQPNISESGQNEQASDNSQTKNETLTSQQNINDDLIYNKLLIALSNLKEVLTENKNYVFNNKVHSLIIEIIYVLAKKIDFGEEVLYKKIEEQVNSVPENFDFNMQELSELYGIEIGNYKF